MHNRTTCWVNSVTVSLNDQILVSGTTDFQLNVWDMHTGECLNSAATAGSSPFVLPHHKDLVRERKTSSKLMSLYCSPNTASVTAITWDECITFNLGSYYIDTLLNEIVLPCLQAFETLYKNSTTSSVTIEDWTGEGGEFKDTMCDTSDTVPAPIM